MKINKRGQIPIVFVFIFAIIVAGLLLTWGLSAVFKIIKTSEDTAYLTALTDLDEEIQKMNIYEPGSVRTIQVQTPTKIQQICFTDSDKNFNHPNKDIKFLMQNSNFNTFILPLDAFKQTGFKIDNIKGKANPECIQVKNNQLKAKLTTFDNYVEISNL